MGVKMMLPLPLLLLMASSEGFLMTRVDPGIVETVSACFAWWTALMSSASGSTPKSRNVTLYGREQRGISRHRSATVLFLRRRFSTASTTTRSVGSQLPAPPPKTRALGGARLRNTSSWAVGGRGHLEKQKFK